MLIGQHFLIPLSSNLVAGKKMAHLPSDFTTSWGKAPSPIKPHVTFLNVFQKFFFCLSFDRETTQHAVESPVNFVGHVVGKNPPSPIKSHVAVSLDISRILNFVMPATLSSSLTRPTWRMGIPNEHCCMIVSCRQVH